MLHKEYVFTYKNTHIPYSIYQSSNDNYIEGVIFLGSAQVGEVPKWVAEYCPPKSLVVQGAPHWLADASGLDTIEFMYEYVKNALHQLLKDFKINTLNVIGESQSVPALVSLFNTNEFKSLAKNIVLIQPLGLTSHLYDKSRDENIHNFKRRVLANTRNQVSAALTDKRYRHNFKVVKNKIDFKNQQIIEQYNIGLAHDATKDLGELYNHNKHVHIISGSKDAIFPAQEIQKQLDLNNIGIKVLTVNGIAHSSLATRQGRLLLEKAFALCGY